ncbi:MAG: hypothetical protein MZV64_19830 [Ignavibacteriales bacterium]|nr:hypothetical protein [Ignavibacteriales bacterium]
MGYEAIAGQRAVSSAPPTGLPCRPVRLPYGLLAFSSVPREKEIRDLQPLVLPSERR